MILTLGQSLMPSDFDRHVILSGCSGGGKSALLAELAARGFATVPEPGRRIVETALAGRGGTLPWIDLAGFARAVLTISRVDRQAGFGTGAGTWRFFDRGVVDAAVALAFATDAPLAPLIANDPRFHAQVFLVPPWRELFAQDAARRHDWAVAVAEHDRLHAAYADLGYRVTVLPKVSIAARADFVLRQLDQGSQASIAAQP